MYLTKKEADKILGFLAIEFSKKEVIYLFRGLDWKIKFFCTDQELTEDEGNLETLISSVPKTHLLKEIKQIRPDLSFHVNKIVK